MSDQITVGLVEADTGEPLAGIEVKLYSDRESGWMRIAQRHTDSSGRVLGWPGAQFDAPLSTGNYKLNIGVDDDHNDKTPYPYINVVFSVDDAGGQYHVAVMVGQSGYVVAIDKR